MNVVASLLFLKKRVRRPCLTRVRQGEAASNVGRNLLYTGEYDKATEMYAISLSRAREVGDREAEANALANLGLCAKACGRLAQALHWHTVRVSF